MPRPRSDIGPRIVRAARKRFLREGVDGASLRRIAADAGTSIGMIYYYFPTKDDLFLAAVEEVYAAFVANLGEALAHDAPVEERLVRLSTRIGRQSRTEREVIRLVLREALVSSARRERLIERFRRGHLAMMLETLSDGVARGEIDGRHHPIVLMMTAFAVAGLPQLVRGLASKTAPFRDAPEGEELARALVDVLFGGIAPRARAMKEV